MIMPAPVISRTISSQETGGVVNPDDFGDSEPVSFLAWAEDPGMANYP
jgi:hypothetical protein